MFSDITFSALTDVGRKRDHNEDNFLVDKNLGFFVVCDGMGGHAAGEVASALAVRTMYEELKRELELIEDFAKGSRGANRVTSRQILSMLEFAANRASARVYADALTDEKKRGMGTTLVAVLLAGNQLFVTWVGDSRLYLLRDGLLEQLTEDHNVFNELVKRKKMPRDKVEKLAQKNAITRAIGVYEHAEPESLAVDLLEGDRLLLCTDGLYQYFEDDLDMLAERMDAEDVEAAVRRMIDEANEAGGSDNITGVLISVGAIEGQDSAHARKLQLKRELLSKLRLFRPLSDRELLRLLQVTEVARYGPDELVMQQGETGEELFIVLEGSVKVMRGETTIAILTQGAHVGEMALVRNQPRSATVKCIENTELMVIRRREFFELLRTEHALAVKLLWQFLGVVADRLAETSRELGQAREELGQGANLFDEDRNNEHEDRPTIAVPRPVDDLLPVIDEGPPLAGPLSSAPAVRPQVGASPPSPPLVSLAPASIQDAASGREAAPSLPPQIRSEAPPSSETPPQTRPSLAPAPPSIEEVQKVKIGWTTSLSAPPSSSSAPPENPNLSTSSSRPPGRGVPRPTLTSKKPLPRAATASLRPSRTTEGLVPASAIPPGPSNIREERASAPDVPTLVPETDRSPNESSTAASPVVVTQNPKASTRGTDGADNG